MFLFLKKNLQCFYIYLSSKWNLQLILEVHWYTLQPMTFELTQDRQPAKLDDSICWCFKSTFSCVTVHELPAQPGSSGSSETSVILHCLLQTCPETQIVPDPCRDIQPLISQLAFGSGKSMDCDHPALGWWAGVGETLAREPLIPAADGLCDVLGHSVYVTSFTTFCFHSQRCVCPSCVLKSVTVYIYGEGLARALFIIAAKYTQYRLSTSILCMVEGVTHTHPCWHCNRLRNKSSLFSGWRLSFSC